MLRATDLSIGIIETPSEEQLLGMDSNGAWEEGSHCSSSARIFTNVRADNTSQWDNGRGR